VYIYSICIYVYISIAHTRTHSLRKVSALTHKYVHHPCSWNMCQHECHWNERLQIRHYSVSGRLLLGEPSIRLQYMCLHLSLYKRFILRRVLIHVCVDEIVCFERVHASSRVVVRCEVTDNSVRWPRHEEEENRYRVCAYRNMNRKHVTSIRGHACDFAGCHSHIYTTRVMFWLLMSRT
jgi:hypothetical protein